MPDSQSNLNDQINELVKAGNTEAAVKMLYDAVVSAAKNKDFAGAEALRDRLYEVDAMALAEIIKSNEVIEQEKRLAINSGHKQIWSSLYDTLSQEEANAFFFAMEEKRADTDSQIIKQGQLPGGLLFINKGQAKLVWKDAGTEVVLCKLNPGDIAGHDTFFDISMATTSLIALTPVNYSLLKREKTVSWDQAAPSLLFRLREYCRRFEHPWDLVGRKGLERRRHQRFHLAGKVKLEILNSAGTATGKQFNGELCNISKSGLGFQVMLSNHKTAVMLLGRSLRMSFSVSDGTQSISYKMIGTINSVTELWLNEFTVHVRFDAPVPASLLNAFSSLKPLPAPVNQSTPVKQRTGEL